MSELASLSLFPATPDQVIASRKRSSVQWAKGMTLEHYLQRDASLDVLEHAANGRLTTWVLAPISDPKTLDFKCSCETYLREGFVVQASGTGSPKASEVACYGIATVFTPVAKRGNGYAKHMMRLLHWVMAPHSALSPFPEAWGTPPHLAGNAKFSALYSDIGDFYSLCGSREDPSEGWVIRNAFGTIWAVGEVKSEFAREESDEWEWLDIPGVDVLLKEDTEWMKNDLIESTKSTGLTSFAFLSGEGLGVSQIYRCLFSPPVPQMNKWGVFLKKSSPKEGDPRTFATWSIDKGEFSALTLIITRLRATPTTFRRLLYKFLEVAREHNLQNIEVWNLPKELVEIASQLGGKTAERDEHLPAFKWYGDEKAGEVDWLFNEKFCWC